MHLVRNFNFDGGRLQKCCAGLDDPPPRLKDNQIIPDAQEQAVVIRPVAASCVLPQQIENCGEGPEVVIRADMKIE